MRRVARAPSFRRMLRRYLRRNPQDRDRVARALERLAANPFEPTLETHMLKGELSGLWACTVAYDCRIVFDFVTDPRTNEEIILLIRIGTHAEVY